jgi:hypothetical protein
MVPLRERVRPLRRARWMLCMWLVATGGGQAIAQGTQLYIGALPAAPGWTMQGATPVDGRPPIRWGCVPGSPHCVTSEAYRLVLERQRRFETLGQDASQAAPPPSIWRVPQTRYLPPPTPEADIQPAYRDRGVVRPEFRDSGQPINRD